VVQVAANPVPLQVGLRSSSGSLSCPYRGATVMAIPEVHSQLGFGIFARF